MVNKFNNLIKKKKKGDKKDSRWIYIKKKTAVIFILKKIRGEKKIEDGLYFNKSQKQIVKNIKNDYDLYFMAFS